MKKLLVKMNETELAHAKKEEEVINAVLEFVNLMTAEKRNDEINFICCVLQNHSTNSLAEALGNLELCKDILKEQ